MNDERLTALYAQALEQQGATRCPVSPEDMIAVLERTIPDAERQRVMLEIMRHRECRDAFAMLRALVEERPDAARPRTTRSLRPIALAAALVLALGAIAAVATWRGHIEPDVLRDEGPRSELPLLRPDERVAASTALAFAWRPVVGAQGYEYILVTKGGRAIFARAVSDTTLALPDSVRLRLGEEYRWWVDATLSNGHHIHSRVRPLRVEKP